METNGDFKKSAELAGYSGNHYQVLKSLKEEVVDLASDVLAREAPQAAFKIINPGKKFILKYTTVSGVEGFDGSLKKAEGSVLKSID